MAILAGPSRVPSPGGIWFSGEPVAWVADNTQKGVCAEAGTGSCITLHAGPNLSRDNWSDATRAAGVLLQKADTWLGSQVERFQTHRWRFSKPTHIHNDPVLSMHCPEQLVLAGDAFGGARVGGPRYLALRQPLVSKGFKSQRQGTVMISAVQGLLPDLQ